MLVVWCTVLHPVVEMLEKSERQDASNQQALKKASCMDYQKMLERSETQDTSKQRALKKN